MTAHVEAVPVDDGTGADGDSVLSGAIGRFIRLSWIPILTGIGAFGITATETRLGVRAAGVLVATVFATAAIAWIATRLDREPLSTGRLTTPFRRPPADLPSDLGRISAPLAHQDKGVLPAATLNAVRTVAVRRLVLFHELYMHDPIHRDEIARRVSPALWRAIRPKPYGEATTVVPLSELGAIVAELDALAAGPRKDPQ